MLVLDQTQVDEFVVAAIWPGFCLVQIKLQRKQTFLLNSQGQPSSINIQVMLVT